MKSTNPSIAAAIVLFLFASSQANTVCASQDSKAAPQKAIPWSELGARAQATYSGEGLSVAPTAEGAVLNCVFQKLKGEATSHGLFLISRSSSEVQDRFQVLARSLSRDDSKFVKILSATGTVDVADQIVRFNRPLLLEEYTTSLDGVRQDFVISEKLPGTGPLHVELAVRGATTESTAEGARLRLNNSGRKISYAQLQVVDAKGRPIPAQIEVTSMDRLTISVDDANAVYPLRIDPTFSDENWSNANKVPGVKANNVYVATTDASGNLYIGGDIFSAGGSSAKGVAKWNGAEWSGLGSGISDTVYALATSGNDLYAGGTFTSAGGVAANRIAKWDGNAWSPLGSGCNSVILSLAATNGTVYASGFFDLAGGVTASAIAKWDGSNWSSLGKGLDTYANSIVLAGNDVYVGGQLTQAYNSDNSVVNALRVARWNGTNWSALGTGVNGYVNALAVMDTNLYVGGEFTTAGGNPAKYIAKWDGSSWSPLGAGLSNYVYGLAVSGSNLYAGGTFTFAGTNAASRAAVWNGSSWSALETGLDNSVSAITSYGSDVYFAGSFFRAGTNVVSRVAKWNGTWVPLGSGFNKNVGTLLVDGSIIYASGLFTGAPGNVTALNIAKWDGSKWSAMGPGLNNYATTMIIFQNTLYAGGAFGSPVSYLAKWDGTNWSQVGGGLSSLVSDMAVIGTNLYVGGQFQRVTNAGVPVNALRLARWNGTNWSAISGGVDGGVNSMVASGTDLYFSGGFTKGFNGTNPITLNYIGKWDGNSFSALAGGLNNGAVTLDTWKGDLYAGGFFTRGTNTGAVTVILNYAAKWNGSSWNALGSGVTGNYVASVLAAPGGVYFGGNFTVANNSAGPIQVNNICRWDGNQWWSLGSGMDSSVNCLARAGRYLYACGDFSTAGGKGSPFLAKADVVQPLIFSSPVLYSNSVDLTVTGSPNVDYTIEKTSYLNTPAPWTAIGSVTPDTNGAALFQDTSTQGEQRFYRAYTQ